LGSLSLTFPDSGEESFAQTRSFSTLYLATLYISALWGERLDLLGQMERLPETANKLIANFTDIARQFGGQSTLERYYFLGSGPQYGLAAELSLKMKEMSLSQSEPFHFMEFRHGPMSMVNEQTLLVGLVSTKNMPREMAVLQEMQARGAKILSLGEAGVTTPFDSGIDEAIRGPLYLPLGQILAFSNARSKGLNPDRPSGVQAVIRLGP
jgi:glucosamine--fructose-6-phosphate aminotransferase (isomerizing)